MLFVCEYGGQLERFPWIYAQVAWESPASTREIPHGALALERSSIMSHSELHGEATEVTS